MQKLMKPFITILSIAFFLVIALASGPDRSTNTTVAIQNCMAKPLINVIPKVSISFMEEDGTPITVGNGRIYITHQIVTDNALCIFSATSDNQDFLIGPDGKYSYTGNTYLHNNSEDLFRVEVILFKSGSFEECKPAVQVGKYSTSEFYFNCIGKRLADL